MKRETAEKAAKWWADKLRGKQVFDAALDNPVASACANFLADILASKRTQDQINCFEKELAEMIFRSGDDLQSHEISVDYNPGALLSAAGILVGITVDGALPWKTRMKIDGDDVIVMDGYGARHEKL